MDTTTRSSIRLSSEVLPFTSLIRIAGRIKHRGHSLNLTKALDTFRESHKHPNDSHLPDLHKTSATFFKTLDPRRTVEKEFQNDLNKFIANLPTSEAEEKELVENLDTWDVTKATQEAALKPYTEKVYKKTENLLRENADEIMKTQSTLFYKKRNTIKPQLETKKGQDLIRSVSQKRLHEKLKDIKISQCSSANMDYEVTVTYKYKHLLQKIERKKALVNKLIVEKTRILDKITEMKRQITFLKILERKSSVNVNEDSNSVKNVQRYLERERRSIELKGCDEQIGKLREEVEEKSKMIKEVEDKIAVLKFQAAKLREEQSEHYHKLLAEGIDTRQEGLSWIIKAIWSLGKNVNMGKIPSYLDENAINYLFNVARKGLQIDMLKQDMLKLYNSRDTRTKCMPQCINLEKQIEGLRKHLKEVKEKEHKRIIKEFTNHKYAILHNVPLKTVLITLFGVDSSGRRIASRRAASRSKHIFHATLT